MAKNRNKNKKDIKPKHRGWEALEKMLHQRGLKRYEIEEAQNSFYSGIEILSNMFLSCSQLEKGYNKNNKKKLTTASYVHII